MQVFRYVMMFRQGGNQQFKLPNGYCRSADYACRNLRLAVRFARQHDYYLMIDAFHTSEAYLRSLYDLTDWFPNPAHELLKIEHLLDMLYLRSRKGVQ